MIQSFFFTVTTCISRRIADGVTSKTKNARISVLVFPFIDLFGVFTNKVRTPVLELIASLAVLAFKVYLNFFFESGKKLRLRR